MTTVVLTESNWRHRNMRRVLVAMLLVLLGYVAHLYLRLGEYGPLHCTNDCLVQTPAIDRLTDQYLRSQVAPAEVIAKWVPVTAKRYTVCNWTHCATYRETLDGKYIADRRVAMPAPAPSLSIAENEAAAAALSAYRCADAAHCDSEVLGAKSISEAAWLRRNGYPSVEQQLRLSAMSDTELKAEADNGLLAAKASYGERLVSRGNTYAGMLYIFEATQQGSIHAYYAMSSVYQHTPRLKSIVESGAYLKVAATLGDTKAEQEMHRRWPGLSRNEYAAMDARAASLYETFALSKPPSPRP